MMRFAESLISLTGTICALSCLIMVTEYLLPDGSLKSAVSVSTGILFLAAVTEQIAVIFM